MQSLITDFFGHKIHASDSGWPNRLCAIADIFSRHDGMQYDQCRDQLMHDFREVAPRISAVRENPQWRDEITAYASYLGVVRFRLKREGWTIEISATARQFLLGEAPDVAAFLRLQLPLFQYPNGMGVVHRNKGQVQVNARKRSWKFVKAKAHISPVRLLAVALQADAKLREVDLLHAQVNASELYALANHRDIYSAILPPMDVVSKMLCQIRAKQVAPPVTFETRFHVLNHMQVFNVQGAQIGFRSTLGEADRILLLSYLDAIVNIDSRFDAFDECRSEDELRKCMLSDAWGDYYDALVHKELRQADRGKTTQVLVTDSTHPSKQEIALQAIHSSLRLRTFGPNIRPYSEPKSLNLARILADPEATRIKKERRNMIHAQMVERLKDWLEDEAEALKIGDSEHIDLWAELPSGRVFIFEIKSGGDGMFEQVRKGVSQLYEYRYRYSRGCRKFKKALLCLVLPEKPPIDWMPDYLCRDRVISLCMHPLDAEPKFHRLCRDVINPSS